MEEQRLYSLLESLAEKIGSTTELLWNAAILQARIWAFSWFIVCVVMYFIGKWMLKAHKEYLKNQYEDNFGLGIVMGIGAIFYGWIAFMLIDAIDLVIAGIINPEWWALKSILKIR